MAFFILTRFVLVKYSRVFVERPSQGTSSLASRLTTVSLDEVGGVVGVTVVVSISKDFSMNFSLKFKGGQEFAKGG